jgi:hypothetical protein
MVSNLDRLTEAFREELFDGYLEAKTRYHYNANRLLQMLEDYGGVETARRLLGPTSTMQTGLTEMWKCGRLGLTVEARVLIPKYERLFTPDPRNVARDWLLQLNFPVDKWLKSLKNRKLRPNK